MYELGKLLAKGDDGVAKARLYHQAADLDDAHAIFNLGLLLGRGEDGIAKDVPAEARLYRQAGDLGDTDAMYNLGLLLGRGEDGGAKDVPAVARLYRQAADLGNKEATHNLGVLLQRIKVQAGRTFWNEAADCDRRETTQPSAKLGISGESEGSHVPDVPRYERRRTSDANRDPAATQAATESNRHKYDVFTSHAGPDKLAMAEPICKALALHNVHMFLDMEDLQNNDCTGPEAMERAIGEARVGIFVLSPEFASRKWRLRELRHFLERDEKCRADRRPRPVVLQIFFPFESRRLHAC